MKEVEMEKLLNELYAIKEKGIELDEYQKGVFDTLCWLIDGTDKPELE